MPSTSPAQAKLMGAVAHGWKPTQIKGGGPSVAVAKEFNQADEAKGGGPDAVVARAAPKNHLFGLPKMTGR